MPPRRRDDDDEDYKYMQLIGASCSINQRVNLIGIVLETTLPKRTKGTDLSCSVKIVDGTQPKALSIMFFAETVENLPCVASNGDIILVSQVTISSRGSEVYAMYNKKFSSFALYEGRDIGEKEFAPYQYSRKFSFREQDKRLITGMRKWLVHNKIEGLSDLMLLREIKEGEFVSLLCKIMHVHKVKKDKWMLFLWDGTDTPPARIEAKLVLCSCLSGLPPRFYKFRTKDGLWFLITKYLLIFIWIFVVWIVELEPASDICYFSFLGVVDLEPTNYLIEDKLLAL